jgi:serine/threonine protein kinase
MLGGVKTKNACPLEQVASCRNVPEHHEPVETSGVPFQPGHLLDGRFLVMEVLSRSGMATIFKAEDKQNGGRPVAVKVPHLEYESDPNFFSRFYNLGALLYEMLTGQVPFQDENQWAALNARVTGDPTAPRKVHPDLSAQAEEIVLRALQRAPADRYPSAAAMKAELDTAEHVRVTGLADRLVEPSAWKPGLFQRPLVLAITLLGPLTIGIIVLLILLLRGSAGAH